MSYKYIGVPKIISSKECAENGFVFAPSKYSRFIPNGNVVFVPLSDICKESKTKISFNRREIYHYSEIGDIDVSTGTINSNSFYGLHLPSENPKIVRKNDILVSTVRSYRGGFGMVDRDTDNMCCSPAILVIRNVDRKISKEYLLAVLRTDFTIEQILGFQTRGMYPRLDSDAMDKLLIPIPKDEKIIKYISNLMRACLNKNELIKQRHAEILRLIDEELHNNQKEATFTYHFPTLNEIQCVGRLDTGLYTEDFKKIITPIHNYKGGVTTFRNLNYKALRGPNLAISVIGPTHYSSTPLSAKYYRLIQPMDLSDYGTLVSDRYFGNQNNIQLLKKGDILFGAEGNIGKVYILIDIEQKTVTNFHGMSITNNSASLQEKCFVGCWMMWLKKKGFFDAYSVGGQGGSYGVEKTENTIIPIFPKDKQKEIAALYHNPQEYLSDDCTIDNFLSLDDSYNSTAGIYELDKTAKHLQQLLNQAIDDIVNDREVEIKF